MMDHSQDCKGQKQSPINIETGLGQNYAQAFPSPSRLLFSNYNGGPGQPLPMDKMVNNGHTVVSWIILNTSACIGRAVK